MLGREAGRKNYYTTQRLGNDFLHVAVDDATRLAGRLRRIAAELRAAGVMDDLANVQVATDHPQLAELTSRQREILVRLLNAQRVSLIAAELYVSPSTVRNHLTTIFTKFGVHSQAELLGLLRSWS